MSVSHEPAGAAGGLAVEPRSFLDALEEVSEAVEAGAGLPSVARAAGRALDASVIVLDAREQRARGGVCVARGRACRHGARGGHAGGRADGGRGRGGRAPLPDTRRRAAAVAPAAGGEPDRPRGRPGQGSRARERGRRGRLRGRPACAPHRRRRDRGGARRRARLRPVRGGQRAGGPRAAAAPGGGRLARSRADGGRARRPGRGAHLARPRWPRPAGRPATCGRPHGEAGRWAAASS